MPALPGSSALSRGSSAPASPHWFTTTHWSVVLATGDAASARAHEALGRLCQTYWAPLYAFVRRNGYGEQDSQDLTQEFLAGLIAREGLTDLRPAQGRFRSFLLASLKNSLSDARDRAQAQKRGGGLETVSLDETSFEASYQLKASKDLPPDRVFERRWACALLETVMTRLAEEQAAAGKGALFNSLRPFLAGEAEGLAYADVAGSLHLSEEAARMTVSRLRRRYLQLPAPRGSPHRGGPVRDRRRAARSPGGGAMRACLNRNPVTLRDFFLCTGWERLSGCPRSNRPLFQNV